MESKLSFRYKQASLSAKDSQTGSEWTRRILLLMLFFSDWPSLGKPNHLHRVRSDRGQVYKAEKEGMSLHNPVGY